MLGRMCSKCGQHEQLKQKTICKVCDRVRAALKRKKSKWGGECIKCGTHVDLMKNVYHLCIDCYNQKMKDIKNETKYKRAKTKEYTKMHLRIAEMLSGKNIDKENLVTHHLNERKDDNHPSNLVILTRSGHSQLHVFLRNIRGQYRDDERYEREKIQLSKRFLDLYSIPTIWLETLFNCSPKEKQDFILNLISEAKEFLKNNPIEENSENLPLTDGEQCDSIGHPSGEINNSESRP